MSNNEVYFKDLKDLVQREYKIVKEMVHLSSILDKSENKEDKGLIVSQINTLKISLKKTAGEVNSNLEDISIIRPLNQKIKDSEMRQKIVPTKKAEPRIAEKIKFNDKFSDLDKKTVGRLKNKEKNFSFQKEKKPSKYIGLSSKIFGKFSNRLVKKEMFSTLKRDLIKAHLEFTPNNYVAMMLFSSFLVFIVSLVVFVFFLFFSVSMTSPFLTSYTGNLLQRFGEFFWIFIVFPFLTFLIIYTYPSLEKKYLENRINQELPFATIHMSAISGSLIEPSKIFSILISTKEYPFLQKEFTKLINEINVYGHDLATSLRNTGFNSPSTKLAELFNGMGTTINSGGSLVDFFEKRSQSLLFEYQIEREKYTKTAETFMDIYISLVIAAPMILMLLLMMMGISGLGISLSPSAITIIMILGVTMINIIFLTLLQLKQPPT